MNIRSNIRALIAERYKSPREFALKKGIGYVYLNKYLNKGVRLNDVFAEKLAKALDVPIYRLFTEEDLIPRSQAEKEPAIIEVFPDEETKLDSATYLTKDDFLPIRILADRASLGHGAIVSQERTGGYALIYRNALPKKAVKQKRAAEKIVCIFAVGESMSPTIQDKSLVAIDVEDKAEIRNNRIYAVEIPDEGVTIKRVLKHGEHLLLFADNRDFQGYPRCLYLKDLDYNPICGKVVWTWNRLD